MEIRKYFQNSVAQSRLSLPVTGVYAVAVWLVNGLLDNQLWIQFSCFALSTMLMAILNNSNALIRIFTRLVSCSFLVLACLDFTILSDMRGSIVALCAITGYVTAFRCYDNKLSTGWMFYSSLCLGMASLLFVKTLYFLPLVWLTAYSQLQALSWRTFGASLLGLITPYWFIGSWLLLTQQPLLMVDHFDDLWTFGQLCDFSQLSLQQMLTFGLTVVLLIVGIVHYWFDSRNDKIRIRQFYGMFIIMALLSTVFLILQPQHYTVVMWLIIINTAPLIGHFTALTHSKWSNIAFCTIIGVCVALTIFNIIWTSLSVS